MEKKKIIIYQDVVFYEDQIPYVHEQILSPTILPQYFEAPIGLDESMEARAEHMAHDSNSKIRPARPSIEEPARSITIAPIHLDVGPGPDPTGSPIPGHPGSQHSGPHSGPAQAVSKGELSPSDLQQATAHTRPQ